MMWREVSDEYGPALGIRRSGVLQIFGHPVTDIGWKWYSFMTISLAAHTDRASAPIDIAEPEPGDLAAPQAEPNQQGQDRQIAATDSSVGIASCKQTAHLIGIERLGQTGQPTTKHLRYGVGQRSFRDAFEMQKAEE